MEVQYQNLIDEHEVGKDSTNDSINLSKDSTIRQFRISPIIPP